jgi:hypothetical protein
MTIAQDDQETPAGTTMSTTPTHLLVVTCPQCRTPFVHLIPTPFHPGFSGMLDCLSRVEEDLRQLKRAIEEVVL